MEVAVGLICHRIQAHRRSRMNNYYREKYERSSVYISLKGTSLKSAKKYKNQWQVGYHCKLKEKNLVRSYERDLYLEPLN